MLCLRMATPNGFLHKEYSAKYLLEQVHVILVGTMAAPLGQRAIAPVIGIRSLLLISNELKVLLSAILNYEIH